MFLYFEAINFDAVLFDTADLSTMRGGSMAMDEVPAKARDFIRSRLGTDVTAQNGGASKVTLWCDGASTEDLDAAARAFVRSDAAGPVSLTYGIGASERAARNDAACRASQMWSFPLPDPAVGIAACPEDLIRPATEEEVSADGQTRKISSHVAARRKLGRQGRPRLFERTTDMAPAQSFEEICEVPDGLRDALAAQTPVVPGKMAVIVIDATGAGEVAKTVDATSSKSMSELMPAFYDRVADGLISWALNFDLDYDGYAEGGRAQRRLRMDVLTWAGDDMTFFLPGYAAVPFVREFLRLTDVPFDPDGRQDLRLRHRIGMVTAQQKVPIRQLIAVAQALEAAGKSRGDGGSVVTSIALESAAPPHGDLESYWRALYGPGHQSRLETFTSREFGVITDLCRQIVDANVSGPLSPTQVNRVLNHLGVPQRPLLPYNASELTSRVSQAVRLIAEHRERSHGEVFDPASLTDGLGERPLPLVLAQIAQLAPYVLAGEIAAEGAL